jgi:hypothetical protein
MKAGFFSILTGSAVLAMASMTRGDEAAAPVKPDAVKPAAVAPAASAEMSAEVRERQMKISAEMREISMKLRPIYERLQNDPEMKAAIENLMKTQQAVNTLRETKMRADPESARLLDRLDALRQEIKEMGGPGMSGIGPNNRQGSGGGAVRPPTIPHGVKQTPPVEAPKAP